MDKFLDDAALANRKQVRIIMGTAQERCGKDWVNSCGRIRWSKELTSKPKSVAEKQLRSWS